MYVPKFNRIEDMDEVRGFIESVGAADVITTPRDSYPMATRMPLIWDGDRLVMHMARANDHWKSIEDGMLALAIVNGPEAYISPNFYPSKAKHGRVVPTWNYSAVQFLGRVAVFHDTERLRKAVAALTDHHERRSPAPWAITDAPEKYIDGQLRAIVGVEFVIEAIAAKAKLSQNRSANDIQGVIDGLHSVGGSREQLVARAMEDLPDK